MEDLDFLPRCLGISLVQVLWVWSCTNHDSHEVCGCDDKSELAAWPCTLTSATEAFVHRLYEQRTCENLLSDRRPPEPSPNTPYPPTAHPRPGEEDSGSASKRVGRQMTSASSGGAQSNSSCPPLDALRLACFAHRGVRCGSITNQRRGIAQVYRPSSASMSSSMSSVVLRSDP